MVLLHRHGIEPIGVQHLAVQRQLAKHLPAPRPDDAHSVGKLVELRVLPLECLVPQNMADHPLELGAGDLEHIHRVVIGQALHKVGVVDHRAEGVAADGPGPHEHQVDAEAVPQNVGDEVPQ